MLTTRRFNCTSRTAPSSSSTTARRTKNARSVTSRSAPRRTHLCPPPEPRLLLISFLLICVFGPQDTHAVTSLNFHPSGDFMLVGTSHPMVGFLLIFLVPFAWSIPIDSPLSCGVPAQVRLYDVNTFTAYVSPDTTKQHTSAGKQGLTYSFFV